MAGPNTLQQHGHDVNYPTWGFGRATKLSVQSRDPNNYARVTVHAGPFSTSEEDVGTTGGGTTVIERSWVIKTVLSSWINTGAQQLLKGVGVVFLSTS